MKLSKLSKITLTLSRRSNIIFLSVFLVVSLISLLMKDTVSYEAVASYCDSVIELSLQDGSVLKQSWQASKKKISGVRIATQNGAELSGKLSMYLAEGETIITGPYELSLEDGSTNELEFRFDRPITVEPGRRYDVFLTGSAAGPAILRIDADADHYGCFLDGRDTEQAAGIGIQYVKNSRIFWLYLILSLILSVTLGIMLLSGKNFADTVGMSFIAIAFVIYLFGILGILETGVRFMIFSAFLLLAVEFAYIFKKKINLAAFFTPALLIWLVLFIWVILRNQGVFRAEWDEFSHWGLSVKDMFYSDSFARYAGTNSLMPSYPPFLGVLQYLMMYLNNVFTDNILYIANQLLIISLLSVILKNTSFKRFKTALAGGLYLVMIPIVFVGVAYHSLYADSILGILMAYILVCYFTEKMNVFNWLRIALGIFALSLTKETGIVLAGINVLIIAGDVLYQYFIHKDKKKLMQAIKKTSFLLLFFLISFVSWQLYLKTPIASIIPGIMNHYGSGGATEAADKKAVSGLIEAGLELQFGDFLTGRGTESQYSIMKRYVTEVFSGPAYHVGPLTFSVVGVLLVLLLFSYLIYKKNWAESNSSRLYRGMMGLTIGSTGYFGFLMLFYIFILPHPTQFSSFYRYHGTYLLAALIAFISLLFISLTETAEGLENKKLYPKKYKIGAVLIALMIVTPAEGFYYKPVDRLSNPDALYGYDEIAETFRGFADRSDHVYFICNDSGGYSNLVFLNAIAPVHTDYLKQNIHTTKSSKGTLVTVAEWSSQLDEKYQYVFILHADALFKLQYQEIFEDVGQIADGTVFKVTKTQDDKISLRLIASVSVKDYI